MAEQKLFSHMVTVDMAELNKAAEKGRSTVVLHLLMDAINTSMTKVKCDMSEEGVEPTGEFGLYVTFWADGA